MLDTGDALIILGFISLFIQLYCLGIQIFKDKHPLEILGGYSIWGGAITIILLNVWRFFE